MSKVYTPLRPKRWTGNENTTVWGGTYTYMAYIGEYPPPRQDETEQFPPPPSTTQKKPQHRETLKIFEILSIQVTW